MTFRTATFRQPDAVLNAANPGRGEFCILHSLPAGSIEARWRACLANSDFPTHYAAPEFFLEPLLRNRRLFAVLSIARDEVAGVLTGINGGDHVQSGLSVRPQIAFSRSADRGLAMAASGGAAKASLNTASAAPTCSCANSAVRSCRPRAIAWTCRSFADLQSATGSSIRPSECDHWCRA